MSEPESTAPGGSPADALPPAGGEAEAAVGVRLAYDPWVNYALQQNAVPLVRSVVVENRGAAALEDLVLRLSAEPGLAEPAELRLARIGAGQAHELGAIDLRLSPGRLANQLEREEGELVVELLRGARVLHRSVHPLHVLAYAEWAGARSIPEFLAAFVLPNHPEVERLLGRAREHLARATGSPALDAYPSRDPARARALLAALYQAAADLGLTYASPPASFERDGQKIRTPDQLVAARLGTCLDLALLLAAAAEQAGLNPLLALLEGHAFVGAWLVEDGFADATFDDASRLLKRVALGSIEVVEATGVAQRPPLPFAEAAAAARRHLEDGRRFAYGIDVRAARRHGIRPLPLRAAEGGYAPVAPGAGEAVGGSRAPVPAAARGPGPEAAPAPPRPPAESAPARVQRWKRKLLDLSLRNRLLNFVPTRRTVPLLCPDLGLLERSLAQGGAFQVLPRPKPGTEGDPRDPALYEAQTGQRLLDGLLRADLEQGRLRASLEPEELDRRLVEVERAARTSLEEGGANTLYLALGFVRWYESPASRVERRAPVLLVPLEISRRSVLEAHRLRVADEDARVNVTLLQKLKSDFGLQAEGFEELGTDDGGLDVAGVLRRVRALLLPLDRWDVVEEAAVGHFSFTKYLMWLDLEERSAELAQNAVVRHLIETPNEPFGGGGDLPRPEELDGGGSFADTFCPKDADSSQLCAVHAAAEGRTFVLWGPPGTGKSQTITNVIANAIGHGKRVLFVSEKSAALHVVRSRLEEVGLGPFCLELHSNKAQKARVLAQLQEALDVQEGRAPEDWERQAQRLQELAGRLNAHAEVLHRPRPLGRSLFQGLARLVALGSAPEVTLELGEAGAMQAARFEDLRDHARSLAAALAEVGPPRQAPWRASRLEAWRPGLPDEARRALGELGEAARGLGAALRPLEAPLRLSTAELCAADLTPVLEACARLPLAAGAPRALVAHAGLDALRPRLEGWIRSGRELSALRGGLRARWGEGLFALDLVELRARCARARDSFWPLSWLRARGPRRTLAPLAVGGLPPLAALVRDLEAGERVRALRDGLGEASAEAGASFGARWRGAESDFDALEAALGHATALRAACARLAHGDPERLRVLGEAWGTVVDEGRDLLAPGGALGAALAAAAEAGARFLGACERARGLLALDEGLAFGGPQERGYLERVERQAQSWSERVRDLRAWCTWRRLRSEAVGLGLGPLVEGLERGAVAPSACVEAFERGCYAWWVTAMVAAEPSLAGFDGRQHEELIRRFRDLDLEVTRQSQAVVQARLTRDLPRGQHALSGSSTSEMGVLRRELAKKKRHLPIRRLFESLPHLIGRLKPCMLMSPLSVAQFLTTSVPRFDLVVFDEASQIPVWDAIGAIARGEALVCVGDPKQLPPTSFFLRAEEEGAGEEDVEVEEPDSILDECLAARLPSLRLAWHYRSRHEGLIAFSNHHYYDGRMLTFPAAADAGADLGVSLVHVADGVYDRGRTRSNPVEARRVVEEVVGRLRDPERCRRSIGVVTFSLPQQTLIEDLLDAARREHPEIEPHFTDAVAEPVFVKNLENVQGDERDVILFSLCYGRDAEGRLALNFGPMNRDGGERRLNVAVTRAKRQVVVFSSLRADDLDLARTGSVGMRHLRHFLEYAERGAQVLGRELAVDPAAGWESVFEEQVHRALSARGLTLVPQVGCSGYRVDLGVRDPDAPGRFLLGIECDGAMYHSGKTARDRDRLRQSVLESLGWALHRVWSTDWWQDPDREVERVLARVESLRRRSRAADGAPGGEAPGPAQPARFASNAPGAAPPAAPAQAPPAPLGPLAVIPGACVYQEAVLRRVRGGPEAFHAQAHDGRLLALAQRVVAVEGPIELGLLVRRVAEAYGLQRATERVVERLKGLLEGAGFTRTRAGSSEFLWGPEQDPRAYAAVRLPGEAGRGQRAAEEIPPEEAANAAAGVLRDQVSMEAEALAREAGRLLGFKRAGANVVVRMQLGLELLVASGRARPEGSRLVWAG